MEIIFELLFQLFFEVIGEALLEAGYNGTARVLRSKVGRYIAASTFGFGSGLLWGTYVRSSGHVGIPRSFWVSLALGGGALIAAAVQTARHVGEPVDTGVSSVLTWPWKWPAFRFAGFATINAAIAVGIIVGVSIVLSPSTLR